MPKRIPAFVPCHLVWGVSCTLRRRTYIAPTPFGLQILCALTDIRVDAAGTHVHRYLAKRLRGVAVEQHAPFTAQRANLADRLHHARLAVGASRSPAEFRGGMAARRRARSTSPSPRGATTVAVQPSCSRWPGSSDPALVFGGHGDDMIALTAVSLHHAFDRQIV